MPIIDIKYKKEKESSVPLHTSHFQQELNIPTLHIILNISQVLTMMLLNIKMVSISLKGNSSVRMWMTNMITMIT